MVQTFSYLKKIWWMPLVVMIIPSVVACLLSTPYWEVAFVAAFDYQPYLSASQTFHLMFGDSWQYLWPVVVVAVLQVCGTALIMSAVSRHFRTGKMSLRSLWSMINNSIFPIAVGVAIMSAMSIIWRFLLFGLVTLVQVIAQAASFPTGAALAIIAAVAVAMFVLHVIIITPMLFWAPIMFLYGYRFRDAAAMSFKIIAGRKLFIDLILPMLFCVGIQLLIGFLHLHVVIACVVGCITFLFTNIYASVFTMVTFYNISELERRDIKPYQNIPLPKPIKSVPIELKDEEEQPQSEKKQSGAKTKKAKPHQKSAASAQSKSRTPKIDNKPQSKKKSPTKRSPQKKQVSEEGDNGI